MLAKSHSISGKGGFSLVEMMIAIAIMAILLALGAPTFSLYLANLKIRGSAEGFLSGMQLARADAVRRNTTVEFLLTNDSPGVSSLATTNLSTSGNNWMIRTADKAEFIEGKSGAEGGSSAEGDASPVQLVGSVASVTFNGLGNTTLAGTATFSFTNNSAGTCIASGGQVRCLNVIVDPGGRIKLCDPGLTPAEIAAGDSRAC